MLKFLIRLTLLSCLIAQFAFAENAAVPDAETVKAELTEIDKLSLRAAEIDSSIQNRVDSIRVLDDNIEQAAGDRLAVLRLDRQKKALEVLDELFTLTANLEQQNGLGADTTDLRDQVVTYLNRVSNSLDRYLDKEDTEVELQRSQAKDLTGIDLVEFEQEMAANAVWVQKLFRAKLRAVQEMDALGLSIENHRENLISRLESLGFNLVGRLQLVDSATKAIKIGSGGDPLSAELNARFRALSIRRDSVVATLSSTVKMMGELGIETTEYRQLLLETGEVTTDLFDPAIVLRILEKEVANLLVWIKDNTGAFFTKTIVFLAIIFAFRLIARVANYMIRRSFDIQQVEVSKLMQDMLLSLSSKGIMFLGLLVALSQLGLEITALLTGLGIAGFIVGFALQDSLANFVAGVMILGYRPFDVGDVIEAGTVSGRVSRMSMASTTILTFDNQTLIVPNNKIWGDVIKNITLQQDRKIDLEFNIGLDQDIEQVKQIIVQVLNEVEEILEEPEPSIEFNELTPYSMVFVVRPWVKKEDYWTIRWQLLKDIKEALNKNGVIIPVLTQGVIATA